METTLWYRFGKRFYDPEIIRWINPDPIPQYHDLYNYCGNNPINSIDPEGSVDVKTIETFGVTPDKLARGSVYVVEYISQQQGTTFESAIDVFLECVAEFGIFGMTSFTDKFKELAKLETQFEKTKDPKIQEKINALKDKINEQILETQKSIETTKSSKNAAKFAQTYIELVTNYKDVIKKEKQKKEKEKKEKQKKEKEQKEKEQKEKDEGKKK